MRHFPSAALVAFALSLMLMAPAGAAEQSTVKVFLIDMTAMFGSGHSDPLQGTVRATA